MDTNSTISSFKGLVQQVLTAQMFENLHIEFKCSKHRISWAFNRPETCDPNLVKLFAEKLGCSPLYLLNEYKLGYNKVTMDIQDQWREEDIK